MKKILEIYLILKITVVTLALFLLFITPCYGLDATLKWDDNTEPGFDHYEVFSREEGQSYDFSSPEIPEPGKNTEYKFTGLDDSKDYYFIVRAVGLVEGEEVESRNSREVCLLGSNDLEPGYDRGWAITEGDLKGFKIMYSSTAGITPTLGTSSAIPPLNLPGIKPLGSPLNFQPSPHTFQPPYVKVFIPCPGHPDLSSIQVYYYDEVSDEWLSPEDANKWANLNSIEEHYETNPPTLAFEVYHFSGVQAGVSSSSPASASSGGGGGGGCFIATAAFGSSRGRTTDER
jgi:hypothetical protein